VLKLSKMKYIDLLALGFKRFDIDCETHFNIHGWKGFVLEYKLPKDLCINWNPCDGKYTIYKKHNTIRVITEQEMKILVEFYPKKQL